MRMLGLKYGILQYRYLRPDATVYPIIRKSVTTKNTTTHQRFQLLGENPQPETVKVKHDMSFYSKQLECDKFEGNVLYACTCPHQAMDIAMETFGDVGEIVLDDMQYIADMLHMPLIISMNSYCVLDDDVESDRQEVHEVYYYRNNAKITLKESILNSE